MRLLFGVILTSIYLSQALPLDNLESVKQALRPRRIPYSVVDVDGGAAASSSNPTGAAQVTTVVATSDQTKTVTLIATPAPSVQKIEITKIISPTAPATTVAITLTQERAPTSTANSEPTIQVVNADPSLSESANCESSSPEPSQASSENANVVSTVQQTVTVLPVPEPSPSAVSLTSVQPEKPNTSLLPTQPLQSSTPEISWTNVPETVVPSTVETALTTSLTASTTTSTTYDNGMWHTYYRPWNATSTSIYTTPIGTGSWLKT